MITESREVSRSMTPVKRSMPGVVIQSRGCAILPCSSTQGTQGMKRIHATAMGSRTTGRRRRFRASIPSSATAIATLYAMPNVCE